ncbi:MAG TPA: hypothetical protein ENH40_05380 [Nitrospirae bacterium]|nr:hypothetical protein [Nitrospirota bacterium]
MGEIIKELNWTAFQNQTNVAPDDDILLPLHLAKDITITVDGKAAGHLSADSTVRLITCSTRKATDPPADATDFNDNYQEFVVNDGSSYEDPVTPGPIWGRVRASELGAIANAKPVVTVAIRY